MHDKYEEYDIDDEDITKIYKKLGKIKEDYGQYVLSEILSQIDSFLTEDRKLVDIKTNKLDQIILKAKRHVEDGNSARFSDRRQINIYKKDIGYRTSDIVKEESYDIMNKEWAYQDQYIK